MSSNFMTRMLQGGFLSMVKLVAGLVRVKVLAAILGIEGIGVLSLAMQFQTLAGVFVSMVLSNGVLNLGRPLLARGHERDAGKVLGTAIGLIAMNAVFFLLVTFLARNKITAVLGGEVGDVAISALAIAAVITALITSICEALIMSLNRFDLYVRANLFSTIADAFLFCVGAWFFGVKGAIFAVLASVMVLFLSYCVALASQRVTWRLVRQIHFDTSLLKPLLSFSALMLSASLIMFGAIFLARAHVAEFVSVKANGLLQVSIAFASYLLPFIMSGVGGYLQPVAAEHGDGPVARVELNKVIRTCIRLSSASCIGVALTTPVVIPIAYTGDFLAGWPYLCIYFIGEFFYINTLVYSSFLTAVGDKRTYLTGVGIYSFVLLGTVYLGVGDLGLWAYVVGHVLGAISTCFLAIAFGLANGRFDRSTVVSLVFWGGGVASVCLIAYFERARGGIAWFALCFGTIVAAAAMAPYYPRARSVLLHRLGRFGF